MTNALKNLPHLQVPAEVAHEVIGATGVDDGGVYAAGVYHREGELLRHAADEDWLAAPRGSPAKCKANAILGVAVDEAIERRNAIFDRVPVSNQDMAAMAVAGFTAACIAMDELDDDNIHLMQTRSALARIALAALPDGLSALAGDGDIGLMRHYAGDEAA